MLGPGVGSGVLGVEWVRPSASSRCDSLLGVVVGVHGPSLVVRRWGGL